MNAGTITLNVYSRASATFAAQGSASTSSIEDVKVVVPNADDAEFTYGNSGASKFNTLIIQDRTLAAGASEELNLFDGSLLDVQGIAAGLTNLKGIVINVIANPSGTTTASGATIGNASATQATLWFGAAAHTASIEKDGAPFVGWSPTGKTISNTVKLLKVLNADGANTLTYRLTIWGIHV